MKKTQLISTLVLAGAIAACSDDGKKGAGGSAAKDQKAQGSSVPKAEVAAVPAAPVVARQDESPKSVVVPEAATSPAEGAKTVAKAKPTGMDQDGNITLNAHAKTLNSGLSLTDEATIQLELSAPILPKTSVLYPAEGANYPAEAAAEEALAKDAALPYGKLLAACKGQYPDITVPAAGETLSPAASQLNYQLVAKCGYEKYTAKPYWLPELVRNVDICGKIMGEGWQLPSEDALRGFTAADLGVLKASLTPSDGASFASYYFSLTVYARNSEGQMTLATLDPAGATFGGAIDGDAKVHFESNAALRCLRLVPVTPAVATPVVVTPVVVTPVKASPSLAAPHLDAAQVLSYDAVRLTVSGVDAGADKIAFYRRADNAAYDQAAFTLINTNVGAGPVDLLAIAPNTTTCFVARAESASGVLSAPSNEVCKLTSPEPGTTDPCQVAFFCRSAMPILSITLNGAEGHVADSRITAVSNVAISREARLVLSPTVDTTQALRLSLSGFVVGPYSWEASVASSNGLYTRISARPARGVAAAQAFDFAELNSLSIADFLAKAETVVHTAEGTEYSFSLSFGSAGRQNGEFIMPLRVIAPDLSIVTD